MNSAMRLSISVSLILIVLTGIGFRFYNLDKKVFWMDETFSAHWLAGYSLPEIHAELERKRLWRPAELMKFQSLKSGRTIADTKRALAIDDPKHPPLFYLSLRLWAETVGDSVFAMRLLPAILSLLFFPALWWLCRELFFDDPNRELIAGVALALLAFSPVYVVYAQEAREYSLWAVMLAASSALFLRALRCGGWVWWAAYALSLTIGIYTHTLSVLLWAVHAATLGVLWWQQRQSRASIQPITHHTLFAFGGATVGAVLLFLPWVLHILLRQNSLSENTAWIAQASSLSYLIQTWVSLPGVLFFDPNQTQRWELPANVTAWAIPSVRIVRCLLFAFVVWALIFAWRNATKRSALFIVLLAIVPFLAVALPDVLLGGYRSTIIRFAFPCYLSGHLAVAYFIGSRLAVPASRLRWAGAFIFLLSAGFGSCLLSSQSDAWWNKSFSYGLPRTAYLINIQPKPLLVLNPTLNFLALSRRLESHVNLFLLHQNEVPDSKTLKFLLSRKGEIVFFHDPSTALQNTFQEHGINLKRIPHSSDLWQLEKSVN